MPYSIRKQKCKQSDGDSGSYTLSYTDKKGKGHSACHTSRKKARGQIAAIEGPYEGAQVIELNAIDYDTFSSLYENILRRILVEASVRDIDSIIKGIPGLENARASKEKGNHIRVRDDVAMKADNSEKETYAKEIGIKAFGMKDPQVKMGEDPAISGTYPFFGVSDASTQTQFNIVFGGTKLTGQRAKGYQYEEDVLSRLKNAGLNVSSGSNVETDIHVVIPGTERKVRIETKALGAVFGQPTLLYDYRYGLFKPAARSMSPEAAELACYILNDRNSSTAELVHQWMDEIRVLWNSTNPDPSKMITSEYSTQISTDDYSRILGSILKKNNVNMISVPVLASSDAIVEYYSIHKNTDYIQLGQKGLFHLKEDILNLGTKSFKDATDVLATTVRVQLSASGKNQVLRAQFEMPIIDMPVSKLSLDNSAGVDRFIKAVQAIQVENIKARSPRSELKNLKHIIREMVRHAK